MSRAHIHAIKNYPRALTGILFEKFYNPALLFLSVFHPPRLSRKRKNVRFEPHCRAHLTIRCFVLGNNLHRSAAPHPSADSQNHSARRQRRRGYFSRQNFNFSPRIPPCQYAAQLPKISIPRAERVNPRKTRRRGMLQRAAAIRRAAESKKPKTPTGIFHVPHQRARMLSVVASAARARSPSACAALIKQISHALGAK